MPSQSRLLKLIAVSGLIAVLWFTFLNHWSGPSAKDLAAVFTANSLAEDFINLNDVDASSLVNVAWDGQGAMIYNQAAGDAVTISNLVASTGKIPQIGTLNLGQLLYTDRTYTFTSVPAAYQNKTYIRTANDDKSVTASNYLTFTVSAPADVYVVYDNNLSAPAWLAGWTLTGDTIGTNDGNPGTRKIYKKSFAAGQVVLGGNNGASGSNYNVVVSGSGASGPGSFRSVNFNSGVISQLAASWTESAPGASIVSFSTNNGSTWCQISNGQTLTSSFCFGGSTLKYKVDFPGTADNFQSLTFTWQGAAPATTYTITATAGSGGTITPSGSVTVSAGSSQTFTITPNTGYQIASVLVNGTSVGAVASYTFSNVQANQTISASFSLITGGAGCTYTINAGESINRYSSTATAGQTVCIRAGTYTETLRPANSGTAGNLITFKAYPATDACQGAFAEPKVPGSCKVVIDGSNVRGNGVYLSARKYITIEGFEIKNHLAEGVYFQDYYSRVVEGVQVVNNYIHHNRGDAIFAKNAIGGLLENNEIYANGETAIAIGGQYGSDRVSIRGNNIHYNEKDGVQGAGVNLLIEGNRIYDQFHTDKHQDGIDIGRLRDSIIRFNVIYDLTQLIYFPLKDEPGNYVENVQIYGNILYTDRYNTVGGPSGPGGTAVGIFVDARRSTTVARNITIHSNTIGWTGPTNVYILRDGLGMGPGQVTGIDIRNNIFYQAGLEVQVDPGETPLVDYNIFYQANANVPMGTHTLFADPQFVNYQRHSAWDFHLKSTSPARDAGINMGPSTDFDGNPRPSGTGYDIGAYEYPSGGTPGDTTPPTVSITAPANGATVSGTIAVAANATDNVGVAGVQFKVDGANLGAEDTTAPYAVNWNTTSATNGSHVLTAVARDGAGLTTTSAAVSVTVSNVVTTYTITATAGSGGTITPSGSITVSQGGSQTFSITPNSGYQIAQVLVNGSSVGAVASYTFPNVQANQTISASFSLMTGGTGCTYTINAGESINKYSSTATAGQTVCIRAGTYNETLTPQNNGTATNLITFKAYPDTDACQGALGQPKNAGSCKVVIDGQNIRANGVKMNLKSNIRIEGFEIKNHSAEGVYFQDYYTRVVEGAQIFNNYIHHNRGDAIFAKNGTASRIENNEIYANGETAIAIGGQYGSDRVSVIGNNIHYNEKDGVQGAGVNLLIEGNRIYDQFHTDKHQDGIDIGRLRDSIIRFNVIYDLTQLIYFPLKDEPGNYVDNVQIYGNILYTDRYNTVGGPSGPGAEAPAIFIDARRSSTIARNITIHSNTIGWVGYAGVWILRDGLGMGPGQVTGIDIRNNIFYQSDVEIEVDPGETPQVNYNLFYQANANVPVGANNLFTDPQFVNYQRHSAWDFHLKSTSPARDAGINMGPSTDFDGNPRPSGTGYDIGAYEYPSGGTAPAVCGNGVIEGTEQCDGTALGGQTCVTRGFTGGTLSCTATCTFNTSQCTTTTADTTPPTVPTGLTATAISSTQINLSWTASTDNVGVTGYRVFRNGAPLTTVAGTSYQNTGLSPATTYTYTVEAYDAAGNNSAQSAPVSATTPAVADTTPPVISAVTVSGVSTSTATITWTTNEPATSQVDYGFTASYGQSTLPTTALVTTHSQRLSQLTPATLYHYRVRSKDQAGNEALSIDFTFTTQAAPVPDTAPPQTITDLRVSSIGKKSTVLAWTAPYQDLTATSSGPVASYDLRYARNTTWSTITDANWSTSAQASGEPTPALPGQTETYTLVDLTPGKTYSVALKSQDAAGNVSAISNVVSFTTSVQPAAQTQDATAGGSGGGGGRGTAATDTTAPSSPTNLTAYGADRQAILRWQNPLQSDFVRVLVLRSVRPLPVITAPGNPRYLPMAQIVYDGVAWSFTDTKLINGQIYHYTLYAYDRSGNWSRPATVTVKPAKGGQTVLLPSAGGPARPALILQLRQLLLELLQKLLGLLRRQTA
ncbi:MAG: right-handed parallel beta-helix repeat-containing protein [Candidatus Vogelbacteria bacterium]|nr:right-handed parallel beta-helix repeat-containing protein [Candidatus Vogelbacteria bacterium]